MVILDSVMNTFADDDINLIPNNFSYEYLCTISGANFLSVLISY